MLHCELTNQATWQETSDRFMEHRWGVRRPCRLRARVSAGDGIAGDGRLRDVSTSGAFLVIPFSLPLFSQIAVAVSRGDDDARNAVQIAATVVRRERDGVGLEWCEIQSGTICARLGCTRNCEANFPRIQRCAT